jgi:hypothetical protein
MEAVVGVEVVWHCVSAPVHIELFDSPTLAY